MIKDKKKPQIIQIHLKNFNHLIRDTSMIFASHLHLGWQACLSLHSKKAQIDWGINQRKIKYLSWHF